LKCEQIKSNPENFYLKSPILSNEIDNWLELK